MPSLTLNALISAPRFYVVYHNAMTSITMNSLASVGSYLEIIGNAALRSVSMPSLTYIGSQCYQCTSFYIQSNSVLSALSMPVLSSVKGYIQICYNSGILSVPVGGTIRFAGAGQMCAVATSPSGNSCPSQVPC